MTDAVFAEAVLRDLEKLDSACLAFIDADTANPRDSQLVRQRFRDVNACKAELLSPDLLRLDALTMKVLQSSPGEWSSRFREELTWGQAANVGDLHRHVRRRHPSLLDLSALLRDKGSDGQAKADDQPRTRGRKRKYDPEKDQAMAEAWQRAKDYGTSKKDFARDKGLSLRALNRILNRHAKRTQN